VWSNSIASIQSLPTQAGGHRVMDADMRPANEIDLARLHRPRAA
jgi:hypothetical protein